MDSNDISKFYKNPKPNLNYWTNSPVYVNVNVNIENSTNNYKPIQVIPNDELLNKVENIISTHPYKLDYKLNDVNLDSNKICRFINKYYFDETDPIYKFVYTKDTIDYYIENSLVLSFYSKQTEKTKSKMIGLIIGKKSNLLIKSNPIESIEVNFLILNPKVRNKNLASSMISILTKESIINYSIGVAHYTINNPIRAPHYCLKYYYHRMINIPELYESKFILFDNTMGSKTETKTNYINKYNNFKDYLPNQTIIYFGKKNNSIGKISDKLIEQIYTSTNTYAKNNYLIHEYKTREQIKQLFNSESFHNFILVDPNDTNETNIKNFICINEIKTINSENNKFYLNGYIYTGFYSDPVCTVIEKISQYIYLNKILDVITWLDFFDVENSCTNAVQGSGFLKYYLYNLEIPFIPNYSNGLVTL